MIYFLMFSLIACLLYLDISHYKRLNALEEELTELRYYTSWKISEIKGEKE